MFMCMHPIYTHIYVYIGVYIYISFIYNLCTLIYVCYSVYIRMYMLSPYRFWLLRICARGCIGICGPWHLLGTAMVVDESIVTATGMALPSLTTVVTRIPTCSVKDYVFATPPGPYTRNPRRRRTRRARAFARLYSARMPWPSARALFSCREVCWSRACVYS